MLLQLIGGGVAIYSAHTAFDSAADGINQKWAEQLELQSVETLIPVVDPGSAGSAGNATEPVREGTGRVGRLAEAESLHALGVRAARLVRATSPRYVGDPERAVSKVGLACGSGGSFLSAARRRGCDVLITGEATFHACTGSRSLRHGARAFGTLLE